MFAAVHMISNYTLHACGVYILVRDGQSLSDPSLNFRVNFIFACPRYMVRIIYTES